MSKMTREEAIKAIDHIMYSSPHESTEEVVKKKYYAELLIEYIEHTVEVVHCKECVHWEGTEQGGFYYFERCSLTGLDMIYDDFCSRGERKME